LALSLQDIACPSELFLCKKKNDDAKTSKLSIIIILEGKKVYYVNVLF
jgi:hypothetical protein